MAITINSTPIDYAPLHSENYFVVESDNVSLSNFKYVCDIYISGNLVARLKSFPNPNNTKGIFNVGSIIRSYIQEYFKPATTPSVVSFSGDNIFVEYVLQFGEEYEGTTYTNLESVTKSAYNYSIDYLNLTGNNWNGDGQYESIFVGSILTTRDSNEFTVEQYPYSKKLFVSYLGLVPNVPDEFSISIQTFDGTSWSSLTEGDTFESENFTMFDISPYAINSYFGSSVITSATQKYRVNINSSATPYSCVVNIICSGKHDIIPIHFLNANGGFDTFNFSLVNRQTRKTERKSFEGIEYEYGAGSMNRFNSNNVLYGGTTQFSTRQMLSYHLISDYVSITDWYWIRELIASPQVYLESGGLFFPVIIKSDNWVEKKRYADKLFNLEIDIDVAVKLNTQFR